MSVLRVLLTPQLNTAQHNFAALSATKGHLHKHPHKQVTEGNAGIPHLLAPMQEETQESLFPDKYIRNILPDVGKQVAECQETCVTLAELQF